MGVVFRCQLFWVRLKHLLSPGLGYINFLGQVLNFGGGFDAK